MVMPVSERSCPCTAVGAGCAPVDRAHGDAQPAPGALAQEQPVVRLMPAHRMLSISLKGPVQGRRAAAAL